MIKDEIYYNNYEFLLREDTKIYIDLPCKDFKIKDVKRIEKFLMSLINEKE
jgi:hypothetical protein